MLPRILLNITRSPGAVCRPAPLATLLKWKICSFARMVPVRGRAENTCVAAHLVAMGLRAPRMAPGRGCSASDRIVGRYRVRFRLALMVRRAAAMQMGAALPNCSVRGEIEVVAPL